VTATPLFLEDLVRSDSNPLHQSHTSTESPRSQVDLDTGKGTVRIWKPGTEVVLHLETVDVRHIRVIERNPQRFPDRGNQPPADDTPSV
jgi:hypothetical protein